jgi:hypothetical protein
VAVYEPSADAFGLSKPIEGTLTSWAAPPDQKNVTEPPGAMVTFLGDQKNELPASLPSMLAARGLLCCGTGVAVGGGGGGGGGGWFELLVGVAAAAAAVGAVDGVSAAAVAVAVVVVAWAVAVGVVCAETGVRFEPVLDVGEVTAGFVGTAVSSPFPEPPPHATSTAVAPAAQVRRKLDRSIVLPR